MNRTSTVLIRLSTAAVARRRGPFVERTTAARSQSSLVSSAEAQIGRPLTPMSYAGVARRTTRRAVAVGAAAGAVYAAPVVVAPACRQVVDAYGRVVTCALMRSLKFRGAQVELRPVASRHNLKIIGCLALCRDVAIGRGRPSGAQRLRNTLFRRRRRRGLLWS